jgi:hypothetical protein
MDHDPQTYRESQQPNQIAGGFVDGRKTFALRTADAHRQGNECPDEQRSKNEANTRSPMGIVTPGDAKLDAVACCRLALMNLELAMHLPPPERSPTTP